MSNKETLKEAGYKHLDYDPETKQHFLQDENGKIEIWCANKNHASYGLIYKNTHLEFCSSYGDA